MLDGWLENQYKTQHFFTHKRAVQNMVTVIYMVMGILFEVGRPNC